MLIKMQQISYYSRASKCVFVANQNYNKFFIYSWAFGHCVFVGIKLQQGFYEVFYGCLFLQACVEVCRIFYKIRVQFPHKLLDLQHLDVFVFAQPTCEICYTCEVSFLNATMCVVRWPNLEWKFLARSKKFVKKLRKKNSGNNDEKELV